MDPCVVVDLSGDISSTTTPTPVTIFGSALTKVLTTYTQIPACDYLPTVSLTVVDDTGMTSSVPSVWDFVSASTTHGQV